MTDTINIPRAELQAALDALTSVKDMAWSEDTQAGRELVDTIRARLAQQEEKPEPVAEIENGSLRWHIPGPNRSVDLRNLKGKHFLYTAPPKREWHGLTDEEVSQLWDEHIVPVFDKNGINPIVFARAIEAKLKEKNT